MRAPGRIEFHKGLGCEREARCSHLVAGHGEQESAEGDGLKKTPFGRSAPLTLRERLPDEVADRHTGADSNGGSVHGSNLLKVLCSLRHYYRRDYQFLAILITLPIWHILA